MSLRPAALLIALLPGLLLGGLGELRLCPHELFGGGEGCCRPQEVALEVGCCGIWVANSVPSRGEASERCPSGCCVELAAADEPFAQGLRTELERSDPSMLARCAPTLALRSALVRAPFARWEPAHRAPPCAPGLLPLRI